MSAFFSKAGKPKLSDTVFLQAKNRGTLKQVSRIFHRNRFHTIAAIPVSVMKKHFTFCRSSWIYRTSLTWGELAEIAKVTTEEDTRYER